MEIYIYGFILMAFCVLAFLSRGGSEDGLMNRMAGYLARAGRRLGGKTQRFSLPDGETVRADLATLYPSGRLRGREEEFAARRVKMVLMIILAGDILAIASYAAAGSSLLLTDGRYLNREAVGGEDRRAELELYAVEDGAPADEHADSAQTGRKDSSVAERVNNAHKEQGDSSAAEGLNDAHKEQGNSSATEDEGGTRQEQKQGRYEIAVRAQKLDKEEVDLLAQTLLDTLPARILGDNRDAQHVQSDLSLPAQVDGFPFRIAWESSSYALVDADGTVGNTEFTEQEAQAVVLTPVLTYENGAAGELRYEGQIPLIVIPRKKSAEEVFGQHLKDALQTADEESVSAQRIELPQEIDGKKLIWREAAGSAGIAILTMAVILAVIFFVMMGSRLHERVRTRSRRMALDYPAIISKFVLYIGAGLSVRNVFYKLGEDYRQQRAEGKEERGAYEEILLVTRELQGGIPEQEAYAHLRQRCRSVQYTRLCTLLSQNLRMGNRELLTALQEEARASFEERRSTARELGEEAETKLLLPMILMLAITMVIIIIPAYYSFAM